MTQASHFATTHWSVVLAAAPGSPSAEEALAKLCDTYWYPLYAYARKKGHPAHEAEDLTQTFFTRLLEKGMLQDLSPEKGRFRTFMLVCMKRFIVNEWRHARTQRRGGNAKTLPIDFSHADERFRLEPASYATPERIYDRRWALTALEEALAQLAAEMKTTSKSNLFDALKPYLAMDSAAPPYSEVAAKLRMSEGSVKVAVFRLRARYAQLLRQEIAATLATPADIEDEIRRLFQALAT